MPLNDPPANVFLPEPLPQDPLPLFESWFLEARQRALQPNPDAMVLATVDADGLPAARVVLCKRFARNPGFIVFFSNYESRKAQALQVHPRAEVVFHWDGLRRQARLAGPVVKSPESESDEYFASRPVASRLGAWASNQSRPLASRAALTEQIEAAAARFGVTAATQVADVPRPPHWGGFRLWIETMELWTEGPGRVHDRAAWRRKLHAHDEYAFTAGTWSATRLNP